MDNKLEAIINILCDTSGGSINKLQALLGEDDILISMTQSLLSNIIDIENHIILKEEIMRSPQIPENKISISEKTNYSANSKSDINTHLRIALDRLISENRSFNKKAKELKELMDDTLEIARRL